MSAASSTVIPPLTAPRRTRRLRSAELVTDTGLNVIAVRKPGLPLTELRLRIPFLSARAAHPAQANLLAEALLTGTADQDRTGLAAAVQALGADLGVGVDADRLLVSGSVLAANLVPLLDLVAAVLTGAAYPADEVGTERDRLVERLTMLRSRGSVVAAETLDRRMWGEHPYARDLPQPEAVAAAGPRQLRALHADRVRPGGAVLVVVGDVSPARVLDQVAAAWAGWTGAAATSRAPRLRTAEPGDLLVVDRPGSVQSSLVMGAPAIARIDPRWPALQLANLVFGGYFSSRWTENIREDKGYTYGPHSRVDHHQLGSTLRLEAEVATEVTAPALLETRYELGKIATLPVTDAEVEAVRQYAIGTLALSTSTQAGLAATLSGLAAFGLGLDWLAGHPARLSAVTVEDVSAAAAEFFGPARFASVVVGDAAAISGPLAALGPVTSS